MPHYLSRYLFQPPVLHLQMTDFLAKHPRILPVHSHSLHFHRLFPTSLPDPHAQLPLHCHPIYVKPIFRRYKAIQKSEFQPQRAFFSAVLSFYAWQLSFYAFPYALSVPGYSDNLFFLYSLTFPSL